MGLSAVFFYQHGKKRSFFGIGNQGQRRILLLLLPFKIVNSTSNIGTDMRHVPEVVVCRPGHEDIGVDGRDWKVLRRAKCISRRKLDRG